MADQVKILVVERNGVNLEDSEELALTADVVPSVTTGLTATDVSAALQELQALNAAKVFGNSYQTASGLNETTNTSTTVYSTKVTLTTPSLTSGTYYLGWVYEWKSSSASREMDVRVRDGVTTLSEWISSAMRTQAYYLESGFTILTGVSGVKTYTLEFKVSGAGTTLTMSGARMVIWRVQ